MARALLLTLRAWRHDLLRPLAQRPVQSPPRGEPFPTSRARNSFPERTRAHQRDFGEPLPWCDIGSEHRATGMMRRTTSPSCGSSPEGETQCRSAANSSSCGILDARCCIPQAYKGTSVRQSRAARKQWSCQRRKVRPRRFELLTSWFVAKRSIQLS